MRLKNRQRTAGRRGIGTLVFLVLLVLAVLFVFLFFQKFSEGLTRQRENLTSGRRAFYLAHAAINEALLDFESQINVYNSQADSWFQLIRQELSTQNDGVVTKYFTPQLANSLYDDKGTEIESVRLQAWNQFSINKLPNEKVGMLTITAVVKIPRRLPGIWGKYVRRNVQKAYEFRHVLVTPPRPFDGFTFFLDNWSYLSTSKQNYERQQASFNAEAQKLGQSINQNMEAWRDTAARNIQWCKEQVVAYDDALDEINSTNSTILRIKTGKSKSECRDELLEGADEEAVKNGFDDYAEVLLASTVDPAAWMSGAGYPWTPRAVNWPAFRTENHALGNPVYVVNPTLSSSEMEIRWPDPPDPPSPFPSQQLPTTNIEFNQKADWDGNLSFLSSVFSAWCGNRDATIPPYERANDWELRRHEGLFKLSPDSWVSMFRQTWEPRELADAWKTRASYVFDNQAQFNLFVPKIGGVYYLDGVYHVKGAVKLEKFQYKGSGVIVSGENLDVEDCVNLGDGCLTLSSDKELHVNGSTQAGLLAPRNSVRFHGNPVTGMASMGFCSNDDFSIRYDTNMASKVTGGGSQLTRFWVTVSPYHLACNFLRN